MQTPVEVGWSSYSMDSTLFTTPSLNKAYKKLMSVNQLCHFSPALSLTTETFLGLAAAVVNNCPTSSKTKTEMLYRSP